jgi:hypothetical protein
MSREEDIVKVARELIEFVRKKYNVQSLYEFTCPIHRRLAELLDCEPAGERLAKPATENSKDTTRSEMDFTEEQGPWC